MAKNDKTELGFEKKLWMTADKLRSNMDAAEYKHVVLGLIFLKYISDAFKEKYDFLVKETLNLKSSYFVKEESEKYGILNDPDEYKAENVFYVPENARWDHIQKN